MLHRDYDLKGSVEKKKSIVVSLKELGDKINYLAIRLASDQFFPEHFV
jgi:hypothetical protein